MKKKIIGVLLGSAIISGILYYFYTMNKVKDIEDDTLEDAEEDDFDINIEDENINLEDTFEEDIFVSSDEDLDQDFDVNAIEKSIHFDKVNTENIFQGKNPLEKETATINEIPQEMLDYDSTFFELVCNISRDEAISFILKERDNYTEEQLLVMTNSELADIYSDILNN